MTHHVDGLIAEEWRPVEQTQHDPDGRTELVTDLAVAVAEAKGVDPLDHEQLPPLYEHVDPASLERTLFRGGGSTTASASLRHASFLYLRFKVVVAADGWIAVYERATPGTSE